MSDSDLDPADDIAAALVLSMALTSAAQEPMVASSENLLGVSNTDTVASCGPMVEKLSTAAPSSFGDAESLSFVLIASKVHYFPHVPPQLFLRYQSSIVYL